VTLTIDYTLAPTARFPTPVRQANTTLAYIVANAVSFNIDPQRIFLAGDSAGAQIAAQTALVISDPNYARQIGVEPGMTREYLRGVVLFCGSYDPASLNFRGPFADLMRTVIWSYIGTRDPPDARVRQMSVTPHVTAAYPPTFISVGNGDRSRRNQWRSPKRCGLTRLYQGVEVDTLFFPRGHDPPLDHEYQLLLATDEGWLALERSVAFLLERAK
jgi:acetyl esterase